MKEYEYIVCGYCFNDQEEYSRAQKEAENMNYIRSNTDLANPKIVLKLYHKLIERNTFQTMVGYEFLKELRAKIVTAGLVREKELQPIPIRTIRQVDTLEKEQSRLDHYKIKLEEYKVRLNNAKIVIAFCIIIILGIFGITMYTASMNAPQQESSQTSQISNQFTIST